MQVRLKFLGGAGSVTGSRFLLNYNHSSILIDCGLFQGLKELRLRNWEEFPVDPKQINAVVLTHAHLDHCGYLPKLVKEGFGGPIYCTEPTADLVAIMLNDSAKLQEEEAQFAKKKGYSKHEDPKPLYYGEDVEKTLPMLRPQPMKDWVKVDDHLSIRFSFAGHILGASFVQLKIIGEEQEKIITFSGDIGRFDVPIMFDPEDIGPTDILLLESTYGDRKSEHNDLYERFKKAVLKALQRKGVLIIPAFAVGRSQSLLYWICRMKNERLLKGVNVYLDSPMAIDVTDLYAKFDDFHKLETAQNDKLFKFDGLHFVRKAEESKNLNEIRNNSIIISASGMCTGGRILHHLFHRLPKEQNTILFSGYQALGTRGRDLIEGDKIIRIFGEEVKVNCHIEQIDGFSAHADQEELIRWHDTALSNPKTTFLIHGEEQALLALKNKLDAAGNQNVIIPHYMESFELFNGL